MPRARSDAARIPAAEWLAAAVGCALLLLSVGTLLREALWGDSSPPDIRVTLESVERQSESYLVRFRAVNRGGTTAAKVIVEGRLRDASGATETSEATVDYVPEGSYARGGLVFTTDPRQGQLTLRATGFERP